MWRAGLLLAILGAACATKPPLAQAPRTEQPANASPSLDSYELRQANDRLRREVEELRAELANVRQELERTAESLWRYKHEFGDMSDCHKGRGGRVLAAHGHAIELSEGAEDGVRPGDVFALRRGADYVGLAMVKEVRENNAYAHVEQQNRGKAFPPRAGDVAYPYR
jgi:hypothetical protein